MRCIAVFRTVENHVMKFPIVLTETVSFTWQGENFSRRKKWVKGKVEGSRSVKLLEVPSAWKLSTPLGSERRCNEALLVHSSPSTLDHSRLLSFSILPTFPDIPPLSLFLSLSLALFLTLSCDVVESIYRDSPTRANSSSFFRKERPA